ncbi:hypothetical protein M5K25_017321 [Dendrobium thyrsiflorum]|uniref:Uncharacterized protein n=1 Tax=Dendrobium thyrsiflorum TaxID=117978 RepID=A0ABD0UMF0_DENTH
MRRGRTPARLPPRSPAFRIADLCRELPPWPLSHATVPVTIEHLRRPVVIDRAVYPLYLRSSGVRDTELEAYLEPVAAKSDHRLRGFLESEPGAARFTIGVFQVVGDAKIAGNWGDFRFRQ